METLGWVHCSPRLSWHGKSSRVDLCSRTLLRRLVELQLLTSWPLAQPKGHQGDITKRQSFSVWRVDCPEVIKPQGPAALQSSSNDLLKQQHHPCNDRCCSSIWKDDFRKATFNQETVPSRSNTELPSSSSLSRPPWASYSCYWFFFFSMIFIPFGAGRFCGFPFLLKSKAHCWFLICLPGSPLAALPL